MYATYAEQAPGMLVAVIDPPAAWSWRSSATTPPRDGRLDRHAGGRGVGIGRTHNSPVAAPGHTRYDEHSNKEFHE